MIFLAALPLTQQGLDTTVPPQTQAPDAPGVDRVGIITEGMRRAAAASK